MKRCRSCPTFTSTIPAHVASHRSHRARLLSSSPATPARTGAGYRCGAQRLPERRSGDGGGQSRILRLLSGRARSRTRRAGELGVHLLENGAVVVGSLRVIGATTWTDYELFGAPLRARRACGGRRRTGSQAHQMAQGAVAAFRPEEAQALHMQSRAYIENELAKLHDGPSMVVTHHAATMEAVAPKFQRSLISAAYASSSCQSSTVISRAVGVEAHPRIHELPPRTDANDLESLRLCR